MDEKFSLKDHLFNPQRVALLADAVSRAYPAFDPDRFQADALEAFPRLELKERIAHLCACLRAQLPAEYRSALAILLKALPAPLDPSLSDNDFGDFIFAPFSDFVARYGCTREYLDDSLRALREITMRFSAEDAIRYFLNAFPAETMQSLDRWSADPNYHVRRLCSEGTRPKLPWAQKINLPIEAPLPILNRLFADKTRYVTRSVANHLNDIAKTHPQLVVDTLRSWRASGQQSAPEMQFITKHALRTLVKNGHPEALALLGFADSAGVRLSGIQHSPTVKIGDSLEFSFHVDTQTSKSLVVDYILYFANKQGIPSNKKVFKLRAVDAQAGQALQLRKRHPLKAGMTTRPLYPGPHKVEIQVNGTVLGGFEFELK